MCFLSFVTGEVKLWKKCISVSGSRTFYQTAHTSLRLLRKTSGGAAREQGQGSSTGGGAGGAGAVVPIQGHAVIVEEK